MASTRATARADLLIDQSDLTDRCYARLRALILARDFHPNEKLSTDRLAVRLGVSRTPVKDALHRLEADGLITVSRRVGSFVTPLTERDVQEVFALRLLFELHAAEEGIGNPAPADLAWMRETVQTMRACIDGERYRPEAVERFMALDGALHRRVIELAGNDRLLEMYESLNAHVQIARSHYVKELANAAPGQREHEALVRAYATGDLPLLRRTLRAHITTVRDLVMGSLAAVGGVL
jgi:DNA-binding GntR family transcriptional regulator